MTRDSLFIAGVGKQRRDYRKGENWSGLFARFLDAERAAQSETMSRPNFSNLSSAAEKIYFLCTAGSACLTPPTDPMKGESASVRITVAIH